MMRLPRPEPDVGLHENIPVLFAVHAGEQPPGAFEFCSLSSRHRCVHSRDGSTWPLSSVRSVPQTIAPAFNAHRKAMRPRVQNDVRAVAKHQAHRDAQLAALRHWVGRARSAQARGFHSVRVRQGRVVAGVQLVESQEQHLPRGGDERLI